MITSRWVQVKSLFLSAVSVDSLSGQHRFVEEASADPETRSEAHRLLDRHAFDDGPLASLEPLIGRTLLHYNVIEQIGIGAMSEVYKAFDTHLNRYVALKVVRPLLTAHPQWKERFLREAHCLSALNNPYIVGVHDVAHDKGSNFIVMECVDGQTLATIPDGGLPILDALDYAIQLADALASAHAAGIIHRDLKPSNILIAQNGTIKVVDFGLAKIMRDSSGVENISLTRHGDVLGTAGYIAPEYLRDHTVNATSDVFSFGAVFFEMVSGRQAFPGCSDAERNAAILKDSPAPIGRQVPQHVRQIIQGCLQKDRMARFQSMVDVQAALKVSRARYFTHQTRVVAFRRVWRKLLDPLPNAPRWFSMMHMPFFLLTILSGIWMAWHVGAIPYWFLFVCGAVNAFELGVSIGLRAPRERSSQNELPLPVPPAVQMGYENSAPKSYEPIS
jgi:serine/threonine protein kinase